MKRIPNCHNNPRRAGQPICPLADRSWTWAIAPSCRDLDSRPGLVAFFFEPGDRGLGDTDRHGDWFHPGRWRNADPPEMDRPRSALESAFESARCRNRRGSSLAAGGDTGRRLGSAGSGDETFSTKIEVETIDHLSADLRECRAPARRHAVERLRITQCRYRTFGNSRRLRKPGRYVTAMIDCVARCTASQ